MNRLFLAFLLASLPHSLAAAEPFTVGPFPEKFVWPISGTAQPDPIAFTYGPRRFRSDQRYSFNRGLDLHADKGSPVHAVLDGEVRIAGKSPAYQQPVVQLRHRRPEGAPGEKVFYTNYMYLDEAVVKEGDMVKQGQVIGRSGLSPNNYQRLRFELRDGGAGQANAVHPLLALPYADEHPPEIEIRTVQAQHPHSIVEVAIATHSTEPDFIRFELEFTVPGAEPTRLTYEPAEWNRLYTPKDKSPDPLTQPKLNGLELDPDYFQVGSERYRLNVRCLELPPAEKGAAIKVTAKAIDARGKSAEARYSK